ncbi:putative transcription factor MYB39-like [Capsicum annuum]|nr:putative transcription factor MYB39-like [Capsicum annuum]KAF3685456.1 putative transcription factor MYB39-like [Capsicum annuum]
MPPKWSLGYHQCRWSYVPDARVREIARTFREKKIPCDVIWMDIDYMNGFRCFTFNKARSFYFTLISLILQPERFPDPKSLVEELHQSGFKAIWMLDPGIKYEKGYFAYDSGSEADVWVQTADGRPYIGDVWPGPCVFPDFTQSKARSWWSNLVKDFIFNGVDGIWNDMNEPAIFKTVTKTMPESNIHRGDPEFGGCQNHSYYHNVYGMLMARSTYEGMELANGNKRPFVLTRAGFVGSQRYAATWTGDNLSTWEHLHMSIPMVLQLTTAFESLYAGLEEKGGEKRLFRLAKAKERKGRDLDQVEEVREAVRRMRRDRATGPDEIPVDFWKFFGEAGLRWLTDLFNNIFKSAKMPEAWRWSTMIPLYKNKGGIQSCNNYRGNKLLSHTMKIWERVVELRLRRIVSILENQFGFMPGRSMTEAIHLVWRLVE